MRKEMVLMLMLAAGLCACEPPAEPFPEGIPQERYKWENPAGYGLPPATEEYGGIIW